MNSSRCSKLTVAVAIAVLAVAAVGTAAAVSVGTANVPEEKQVGTEVSADITLTELYRSPQYESWTLEGETELRNVTWTIQYFDQTGSQINSTSIDGQNISVGGISADGDVAEVKVVIAGDVPPVESYTYDTEETFVVADLTQARSNGNSNAIQTWEAHHFTEGSKKARNAISSAESAIESASSAGASVSQAQSTVENAKSAYNAGNFENAVSLAKQAEQSANDARQQQQSAQQRNQMLMYGAIGLVVLLLVGGGVYWYSQQGDDYDKLG